MEIGQVPKEKFELEEQFLKQYEGQQPQWGPVGYITYKRTYARPLENGSTEEYWQTVKRVVEGIYTIQKEHYKESHLLWNKKTKQERAQEMFKAIWEFKFTPPGRGLTK